MLSGIWGTRPVSPQRKYISTQDGVELAYESYGNSGPVVVLIHGWSGSKNYWDRNARPLAKKCRVYTFDLRFHGDSSKPSWGCHVARLAADLRDFLTQLQLEDVTVVGASMGAAIIWSYIELFGESRLSKAVFIDQAPLQFSSDDWLLGSKGVYDIASLTRLQCALQYDFAAVAKGNVAACASMPLGNGAEKALVDETMRADPKALGKLMADHAQLDWRTLLPRVSLPCLVLVGARSGVFPPEGSAEVGHLIKNSHTITFSAANHWLYLEQPESFNNIITEFALHGILGVKHISVVEAKAA